MSYNSYQSCHTKLLFYLRIISMTLLICGGFILNAHGQAVVEPWGNLKGFRIEGQLMRFKTSLCVRGVRDSIIARTAKEAQKPSYVQKGNRRIIQTKLDSINIKEIVTDKNSHAAKIAVKLKAVTSDTGIKGTYFCITLPGADYFGGKAKLIRPVSGQNSTISLTPNNLDKNNTSIERRADGIRFISPDRQLQVLFNETTKILVKSGQSGKNNIKVYLPILLGDIKKGETAEKTFTLKASGKIDKRPITLRLDTTETWQTFDGIGGDFCYGLQKPEAQKVITYNLNHLRVAWGRVRLPWRYWQPKENIDPVKAAKNGKLNPIVKANIKMAQRLSARGIPLILSVWFPPAWAIKGNLHKYWPNGLRGNPLNPKKMDEIYKSITEYIVYLKKHYGVKIKLFSFNESNLGIYVRQTPKQHDRLIKGLGAYFASHGLTTKLLLGDTADANGFNFIKPAMNDPLARKYIGAVSFHSWRGWADSTLTKWTKAAEKLHVPLIVAEGGINAASGRNPQLFTEPMYARKEINLYVRILSICKPEAILQWELTPDYADMAGGGIYGNDSVPLHPTQVFWNLKQLGSTPKGLHFMSISSNRSNVTSAALGNDKTNVYAIHLVNNGPTRKVTLRGLPKSVHWLQMYVTDKNQNMEEENPVKVINGEANFTLPALSFTSLMNGK